MASVAVIELIDVKKSLGTNIVLDGISLEVYRGEVLGLVGPSGSGKTTLLRCINRLIDIDSGDIRFKGKSIYGMDPVALRRKVTLVFQDSVMFPGTVYDNIAYGPSLSGSVNPGNIKAIARNVGLPESYLNRDTAKLSGGERQRVAIARAMAINPEVLLLDEPTSAIDPRRRRKVEDMILRLVKTRGLTAVWVTHNVLQAKRVATRIAAIKNGRLVQVASAGEFRWGDVY